MCVPMCWAHSLTLWDPHWHFPTLHPVAVKLTSQKRHSLLELSKSVQIQMNACASQSVSHHVLVTGVVLPSQGPDCGWSSGQLPYTFTHTHMHLEKCTYTCILHWASEKLHVTSTPKHCPCVFILLHSMFKCLSHLPMHFWCSIKSHSLMRSCKFVLSTAAHTWGHSDSTFTLSPKEKTNTNITPNFLVQSSVQFVFLKAICLHASSSVWFFNWYNCYFFFLSSFIVKKANEKKKYRLWSRTSK